MTARKRSITLEQLETLNEHRRGTGLAHLGIKHCVVEVGFLPLQPEILADARSSPLVPCVDEFDCLVLSFALGDQSADLLIARCVEKCMEDILAIAVKNCEPRPTITD